MTSVGSLCSGYGGLDMGLALALGTPLRHVWHVEYDKHPSAILAHRFPGVPNYGDVKTTDWGSLEPVDWLTAGYPCQPFSQAGLRKGTDDPRHLWPDVAVAIGLLRPANVLLENVSAHLRVGFDVVLGSLAALGYDATWGVVRASDAGAPHGRARLFVVAYTDSPRLEGTVEPDRPGSSGRPDPVRVGLVPAGRGAEPAPDAYRDGRGRLEEQHAPAAARIDGEHRGHPDGRRDGTDWGAYTGAVRRWEAVLGRSAPRPTEPAHRGAGERLSPRFVEWMMGLPVGWVTDVPGLPRSAQLKALGNGVVPQQAALAVRLLSAQGAAVAA